MKLGGFLIGLALMASLSACVKPGEVTRATSSNLELATASDLTERAPVHFNVTDIRITVPRSLTVSEANTFKPRADIVWREDPLGDRYEQVGAIMQAALDRGVQTLKTGREVVLDVTLKNFHALTQRTRYTFGGTHAISFDLTVLDAKTGAVVEPTRTIKADFRAYGGMEALAAEARGETQKVRITDHLAKVMLYEMTRPRDFLPKDFVETQMAQAATEPDVPPAE